MVATKQPNHSPAIGSFLVVINPPIVEHKKRKHSTTASAVFLHLMDICHYL